MDSKNRKREIFYKDASRFFEAGLLKEIYSSDELCICNLANQCYGVCSYLKTSEGQGCILIIPQHVKQIIADPMFFHILVASLRKKTLISRSIVLNDKTFELLQELKRKNDINGPTEDIDIEMEEELINKYKKMQRK